MEDEVLRRVPLNYESIEFRNWTIEYEKSHILSSVCKKGRDFSCKEADEGDEMCELCTYRRTLDLPYLPDMVFHKNKLSLKHSGGAILEFLPMDALRLVENGKQSLQVACAEEWKESRPESLIVEKCKPFDWTFTTNYQGTTNDKFRIQETAEKLNKYKLMQREKILFYHDLTLFEDELHDNGISSSSVKIRVMPSGFYILLRHFLRVDNVLLKIHDTRFHFEIENSHILKEFTRREANYDELKHVPSSAFVAPNEIETYMPIKEQKTFKLNFQ